MKKIKFDISEEQLPGIEPIRNTIPQWYKDSERYVGGKPILSPSNNAMKLCVPFLDAFTQGYSIPLICDVQVLNTNIGQECSWKTDPEPLATRDPMFAKTLPVPSGHSPVHYVWRLKVALELPKGYSLLITHPLNRHDLPFTTMSGIIDADFDLHGGQVPFFLKEGFEGIIPMGTPIAQVIPFKRENWSSERSPGLWDKATLNSKRAYMVTSGWYKRTHWKKKSFE